MSDPKAPGNDPSIDDILASIRKIISDDEARAQGGGSPAPASPAHDADPKDVLLLTELIEDGQPVPLVIPAPSPRPAPSTTFNQPLTPPSRLETAAEPTGVHASAEADPATAAIAALQQMNRAVQDNAPVNAPTAGPALGGGSDKTIEDLVKEMLRPMLKSWLDHNLPPMVQAIVEREISRLTRR